MASTKTTVKVGKRSLELSNQDKVLYPKAGFSKGQVVAYYRAVADVILPHLRGRPTTLKRYPDGVDGEAFYEKNASKHRPDWVKTHPVWSDHSARQVDYVSIDDEATLVWTANLAALELHTSLSLGKAPEQPTSIVFDLDPGPPAELLDCCEVALAMKAILDGLDLASYPKTSGKKGMQLYVPLHTKVTYDETKPFAHAVAELLERQMPERVVSRMEKAKRTGKIFIDWSQNDRHKTTVAAYSLRAEAEPRVSTPVAWSEVETAVKRKTSAMLRFSPDDVIARVAKHGDLFAAVGTQKQKLPRAARAKPNLKEYDDKRDFSVTSEPSSKVKAKPSAHPTFMIHKHHASHLHYDLRLEMDGALASWAIPKGPSLDPKVKRLAVQTEDHPLAYGTFEGRIPEGQYGAGDSIIWDRGSYDTLPPGNASAQRKKGHLDLVFVGEKLNGHFHLVRTRTVGKKAQWIFFASKDIATKGDLVEERPESVVSGRRAIRGPERSTGHGKPEALLKKVFPPMLATLRDELPAGKWTMELKYDGYRAVAASVNGHVALWTRNALDLVARFPTIADALATVKVGDAVIDGEIIALDEKGKAKFGLIGESTDVRYVAFDLLWLDGKDLRREPLETRRELLESVLANAPAIVTLSERVTGDPQKALAKSVKRGFEGLVCKAEGSTYANKRSTEWVKLKPAVGQELAIVGYTPHAHGGKAIGALLLGVADKGTMRYAGKVGTGFSDELRHELYGTLSKDATKTAKIEDAPRMKDATWVKPKLVAEVHFMEWTSDGRLRHPAFVGLRVDKSPMEAVRER